MAKEVIYRNRGEKMKTIEQIEKEYSAILDLNLSENYVPNWGAWEVGREIVSNAIDADPLYEMEIIDESTVRVFTNTYPSLSQIKVIGFGTKAGSKDTIGQFGEGIKLAALVASRLGGSIDFITPEFVAKFFLKNVVKSEPRILHLAVRSPMSRFHEGLGSGELKEQEPPQYQRGCEIYIRLDGIGNVIKGKFLDDKKSGNLKKDNDKFMRVYLKGVYVHEIEVPHIFDWCVDNVEINRDRNLLNPYGVMLFIINWFNKNLDNALADRLFDAQQGSFELQALSERGFFWLDNDKKIILSEAFRRKYGAKAILATNDGTANRLASEKGHPVIVIDEGLMKVIRGEGLVKTATEMIPKDAKFNQVNIKEEWKKDFEEMHKLLDVLQIPAEINIFQHFESAELGRAIIRLDKMGCTVWLNEKLFLPGYRKERLRTLLHELGHIQGGYDESLQFEHSLDGIAGLLAIAWLKETELVTTKKGKKNVASRKKN